MDSHFGRVEWSGMALRADWGATSWFLQSENNPGAMDSRRGAFGALHLRNERVVVIWSTYAPQSNFSGRGLRFVLLVFIRKQRMGLCGKQ